METTSSSSMWTSSGRRYMAGIPGWHVPALQRDSFFIALLDPSDTVVSLAPGLRR